MSCGFDSWDGKIPWRNKWKPIPVFLPGEFHGQRSLMGYRPWGPDQCRSEVHHFILHAIEQISFKQSFSSIKKAQKSRFPIFLKLLNKIGEKLVPSIYSCFFFCFLIQKDRKMRIRTFRSLYVWQSRRGRRKGKDTFQVSAYTNGYTNGYINIIFTKMRSTSILTYCEGQKVSSGFL